MSQVCGADQKRVNDKPQFLTVHVGLRLKEGTGLRSDGQSQTATTGLEERGVFPQSSRVCPKCLAEPNCEWRHQRPLSNGCTFSGELAACGLHRLLFVLLSFLLLEQVELCQGRSPYARRPSRPHRWGKMAPAQRHDGPTYMELPQIPRKRRTRIVGNSAAEACVGGIPSKSQRSRCRQGSFGDESPFPQK